mmetsp:Transcript_32149/g.83310  ORF Transcript_32149/g.83310 Transcript_32149/m.83310 type:complete len:464 (-) Transcript_32149:92-1483(-)
MADGAYQYDVAKYRKWKQLVPFLYDWIANHNLAWPSLTCRWGPQIKEATFKTTQTAYISEQTDSSEMNTVQVVSCEIVKQHVAGAENIAQFNEQNKSPYIKSLKTIFHPGEVNKIREVPQHPTIVITHTDAAELYVWATDSQPDRAPEPHNATSKTSVADLVLTGHKDYAEFALGCSSVEPLVASGGRDRNVVIWNLKDHVTSLAGSQGTKPGASTTLGARHHLTGHGETIEDVCWQPGSAEMLASVGDDQQLMLWDLRTNKASAAVRSAHGKNDIHCVDWCALDTNMLATACAEGVLKIWDKRKLQQGSDAGVAIKAIKAHGKAIMRTEWCPVQKDVIATGSEDMLLSVWNLSQTAPPPVDLDEGKDGAAAPQPDTDIPPELLFQHAGHRSPVVDFQWNPHNPWTLASVSDDVSSGMAGGTLQIWRMNDLIYRDRDEVINELEEHRDFIVHGNNGPPQAAHA